MAYHDVHLVPLLAAGRHHHPRKGGCLLELVSALPGGMWTDHPTRIDPVLGVLARAVNDTTSSSQRPALAQLIPWLAGLPPVPHPQAEDAVLAACARAALPLCDPIAAAALTRDAASATGLLPTAGAGWRQRRARRQAAVRAVRRTVRTLSNPPSPDPDRALAALLTAALSQVRELDGLPPLPPLLRPAAACRAPVPVRSHLHAPDGAESLHHDATALVQHWPRWLTETDTLSGDGPGRTRREGPVDPAPGSGEQCGAGSSRPGVLS